MVKSYSKKILRKLYRIAYSYEQAKSIVLKNSSEELPLDMIKLLLKDKDSGIRIALSKYKYTPADIIVVLSQDKLSRVRASAAESELLTEEYVEKLSMDPSEAVKVSVAHRKNLSQAVLDRLSLEESEDVKLAMSERDGLSQENAKNLLEGQIYNTNILKNVYKNTIISKDKLGELITHPDESIRSSIAKRRDLTPEFIRVLSEDKSDMVKEALAINRVVPPEILSKLYENNSKKARIAAGIARNRNTAPELLDILAEDPRSIIKINLAYNRGISEKALNTLVNNSVGMEIINESVSSRKDIPGGTARILAGSANEKVLENLARANTLPEDVFLILLNSTTKVKKILSARPDVPESISEYLSIYNDILKNNITDYSVLEDKYLSALSQEKDELLIRKLLDSKNKKIIDFIASGGSQNNKNILSAYKNLPEDVIDKLIETGNAAVHLKIAAQKNLSSEAQQKLAVSSSKAVKNQLLDRSDLSTDAAKILAKDTEKDIRDRALVKLPFSERAEATSIPSSLMPIEDFKSRARKDLYMFRRLEKIMEDNNLKNMTKKEVRKYDPKISQHPFAEKIFASSQGNLTLEKLKAAEAEYLDNAETTLRHALTGKYEAGSQQSEQSIKNVPRETLSVTLEEGLPPEVAYFVDRWVNPSIGHGIGLGRFNLGHILFKDISSILKKPAVLIEQIQSDHRYTLAFLKQGSTRLDPKFEADLDSKFGEGSKDRMIKYFTNIRSIYPETLLLEFLNRMRGKEVYITGPERAAQLTRVDPKAAQEVYGKIPSKFGFEPAEDMPGYLRLERANYKKHILRKTASLIKN